MIDLAKWKESISFEFLKENQIDPRIFEEVFSPFIPKIKIKKFRISSDLNQDDLFKVVYNLPISFEIIDGLNKETSELSESQNEQLRKSISFYIFFRTILLGKKTLVDSILKNIYDRAGNQRIAGPFMLFVKKILPKGSGSFDAEALRFVSQFDLLIRNNLEEIGYKPNTRRGRPSNAFEDHFLYDVKKILTQNDTTYYQNNLERILSYLKTNYQQLFSELPLSSEAIKKSLQNKVDLMDTTRQT